MTGRNSGSSNHLEDDSNIDYLFNAMPQSLADNFELILGCVFLFVGLVETLRWVSKEVIRAIGDTKKAYYHEMAELEKKILERDKVRVQRRKLEAKYYSSILKRVLQYLKYRKSKLDESRRKELAFINGLTDEIRDVL